MLAASTESRKRGREKTWYSDDNSVIYLLVLLLLFSPSFDGRHESDITPSITETGRVRVREDRAKKK
jgi:hypothetical protein